MLFLTCFAKQIHSFSILFSKSSFRPIPLPKNAELVGAAGALFATLYQLTRLPNLLIDQLDKLSQLRPVAALVGVAPHPLLSLDRLRPGGLLPRLPLPD